MEQKQNASTLPMSWLAKQTNICASTCAPMPAPALRSFLPSRGLTATVTSWLEDASGTSLYTLQGTAAQVPNMPHISRGFCQSDGYIAIKHGLDCRAGATEPRPIHLLPRDDQEPIPGQANKCYTTVRIRLRGALRRPCRGGLQEGARRKPGGDRFSFAGRHQRVCCPLSTWSAHALNTSPCRGLDIANIWSPRNLLMPAGRAAWTCHSFCCQPSSSHASSWTTRARSQRQQRPSCLSRTASSSVPAMTQRPASSLFARAALACSCQTAKAWLRRTS